MTTEPADRAVPGRRRVLPPPDGTPGGAPAAAIFGRPRRSSGGWSQETPSATSTMPPCGGRLRKARC